ncbi:hypothetical protein KI387_007227 [Taxus chinensis]|uniref:non-specific serine/threonine protein kinase n=1 Tax=Taxus chinensis TaxID=29808 RepID=A0AA38LK83_TAXCH|nr:hypothetical protein KI387_007227 [Taxus chinensis]
MIGSGIRRSGGQAVVFGTTSYNAQPQMAPPMVSNKLNGTSLPDYQAVSYMEEKTPDGCRAACLNNCSCNAYSVTATTTASPVCRLWFGDLLNLRHSSDGQTLFVRLASSDLTQPSSNRNKAHFVSIIVPVCTGLALAFALFTWLKRRLQHRKRGRDDEEMFLRAFTYRELRIATTNFKHRLGRGGFGSVFKGTLTDGALVAVKKLEGTRHGEKQFRAEINTVGNIQHVNLVRLRGFCAEGSHRLLVYDYMPNGSLNSFLFSNAKSVKEIIPLDWKTRFNIALGTARALVYLHDECRDRIIHCDIKPENILLDESFCPKVADFGLAKLMGRDFSRALTTTRGTRGYLAPEWISGMPITAKADVYSFGITLLEIISGRRNLDLNAEESSRIVFPPWALAQIEKGNIMDVIDAKINVENAEVEEVVRAGVVVALCIQEDENARPRMAQVVLMLQGKTPTDTPQVVVPVNEEVADKEGNDSNSNSDTDTEDVSF